MKWQDMANTWKFLGLSAKVVICWVSMMSCLFFLNHGHTCTSQYAKYNFLLSKLRLQRSSNLSRVIDIGDSTVISAFLQNTHCSPFRGRGWGGREPGQSIPFVWLFFWAIPVFLCWGLSFVRTGIVPRLSPFKALTALLITLLGSFNGYWLNELEWILCNLF